MPLCIFEAKGRVGKIWCYAKTANKSDLHSKKVIICALNNWEGMLGRCFLKSKSWKITFANVNCNR